MSHKELSWSEHIKVIAKKANAVKGFLHRNISSCPTRIKLNCYKSLVKPILEYTAVVWKPPHTLSAITSIEKIQRYATRFICGDYSSVIEMLQSLSLPTLSQRRDMAKVTFCTKFYIRLWMFQFWSII